MSAAMPAWLSVAGPSTPIAIGLATVMAAAAWSNGTLLKLFLSPNATVLKASTIMATTVHASKHRGHRPLLGGPGAVELPLGRENLLPLALPHVLGPKLGLVHEVVGLEGH